MKVVINRSCDGFCLSDKAIDWLIKAGCITYSDFTHGGGFRNRKWCYVPIFADTKNRADPLLIQCIEELKNEASPLELEIIEIPDEITDWQIIQSECEDEYGQEWLARKLLEDVQKSILKINKDDNLTGG